VRRLGASNGIVAKDYKMSVKNRVEKLEKMSGYDEGSIYIVYKDDDTYTLKVNDGDDVIMSLDEFEAWERSRLENDYILIVSYRDEN